MSGVCVVLAACFYFLVVQLIGRVAAVRNRQMKAGVAKLKSSLLRFDAREGRTKVSMMREAAVLAGRARRTSSLRLPAVDSHVSPKRTFG